MPVPTTCEICDGPIEGTELRYRRAGLGQPYTVVASAPRCWRCRRLGCPRCLRAVEERADDHFLTLFSCEDCVAELPGPVRREV